MGEERSHVLSGEIYPIKFVRIGNQHHVPTPLVRVSTCGTLKLEVLQEVIHTDPPQGRYHVVSFDSQPRGSSTARTLLKILACLPEHYASKDWLSEYLPRSRGNETDEEDWGRALVRVDNVVYTLRGLLCPSQIIEVDVIRKALVVYVRNHRDSGSGYRLAIEPLLWLDVDVIADTVRKATFLEQQGKDAFLYWEQAYTLTSRGSFLADEMYSDWSKEKRIEIEGYWRQSAYALYRSYLADKGKKGEEQALFILRAYWQTHPLDEDILRPLMDLLRRHERRQEALECYHYFLERLEDRNPDLRTMQIAQGLSGNRVYQSLDNEVSDDKAVYVTHFPDQRNTYETPLLETLSMLSTAIIRGIMTEIHTLEGIDMDSTKRDFLHMLGTSLVLAGTGGELRSFMQTLFSGDQLGILETELAARWKVYHAGSTVQSHEGLSLWLSGIEEFAKNNTSYPQKMYAYSLVSTGHQLQGSIFRDKMDYNQAHHSYKKAFLAADEFDNTELKSSALARRGVTFIQQQKPIDAIQYLEGALLAVDTFDLPYLKGYIFQALSEAHAMAHNDDQSQKNIHLAEQVLSSDGGLKESSNCQLSTTSITSQKGVNAVLMHDYSNALTLLDNGLSTYAPSLFRGRARLMAQKAEAYYGLGYIDESVSTALDAFDIANTIGSQKTIARVKNLSTSLTHSPYKKEKSVAQLERVFVEK